MPGSEAFALSEQRHSWVRPLKNKDFQGGRTTQVGVDARGTSLTLASNKSCAGRDLCVAAGQQLFTASQGRLCYSEQQEEPRDARRCHWGHGAYQLEYRARA